MKRTKAIAVTVMIALAVITFAAAALVTVAPMRASATGVLTAADPDSDIVTYRGETYAAADFIRLVARSEASVQSAVVTQDDPIVGMIPKEKFTTENSSLEIGDEWGYYIMTEKDAMDVDGDSYLRSYVTTFDISENRDSANGTIDLSVSVESQDMYVTLMGTSCSARIPLAEHDFNMYKTMDYSRTGSSPLVVRYGENPRFYLRDMSFAMSLYNENELNYGDSGYMASDDLGSYFVNLDYGYDGSVWQKDGVDVGSDIIEPALDLLIDIFLGQVLKIEPLRTILEIGGYIYDGIKIVNNVIEAETEYVVDETKEITCTAYSANRDDQIAHYGNLIRSAAITVNAQEDKQLWYGTGDHAEARFQIGHSALNDEADRYTRILKEAAFSVIDKKNGSYVASGVDTSTGYLRSPVYKELSLGAEEQGYVLENGTDFFTYTPEYDGRYVLDITGGTGYNEANASVSVTDESGDIVSRQSGGIYELETDETYKIRVSHSGTGARFGVSLDAETLPSSLTVGAGKTVLVSLGYLDGEVSTLSTGSNDVVIGGIYRLSGGELDLLEEYGDTSSVTYAWDSEQHGNYYVTLENTSSSSRTAQLTMADIPSVSVGSDGSAETTVTFDGEHYSYIRFTDLPAGNYTLAVENVNSCNFNLLDESFNNLQYDQYGHNILGFSVGNVQQVYVMVRVTNTNTTNITLNKTENAYKWIVDGEILNGTTYTIGQGDSFELALMINDEIIDITYYISPTERSRYSVTTGYNYISIAANSFVDGQSFTVLALYDGIEHYPFSLQVTPTIKYPFAGISTHTIDDVNCITIEWEAVNNLDSFVVTIPGTSFSLTIDASLYPNNEYRILATSMPSKMPVVTFAITEVYYDWENADKSLVETNLSYSFDYYFNGGNGTNAAPYEINDERQFKNITEMGTGSEFDIYYNLTSDLDLGDTYMGLSAFYGTLYGNNHTIKWDSRYIADDSIATLHALFLENRGRIERIYVEFNFRAPTKSNSIIKYVGGIAAKNYGTIYYCNVSGSVIDTSVSRHVIGGVAAYNAGSGWIYGTNVMGTFTGTYVIGGVAGINDGQINSCYANCTLTLDVTSNYSAGRAAVGQIAGVNNNYLYGCNVGSDNSGYKIYLDIPSSLRPYVGSIVGAQSTSATDPRNCKDVGIRISTSGLSSAQKTNIEKLSNGDIGNEFSGINWG